MTGALTLASPMISVWTSASEADSSGVEAAFNKMVGALKSGNLDGFYGAMHPAFTMIDEDSPFRMSKAEFQDHIGFHVSGTFGRVLNGSR